MTSDHRTPQARPPVAASCAPALAAGGATALGGAPRAPRRRGQSGQPAAEHSGLDALPRRRRRGAQIRQALEARSACDPPRRRMAHGIAESSVSFTPLHELDGIITPNGLCFERHHAGIAEVDPGRLPADTPRPGRQAADLHARRSSSACRGSTAPISANARRIPAWSGAARSSTAASTPTAWCIA